MDSPPRTTQDGGGRTKAGDWTPEAEPWWEVLMPVDATGLLELVTPYEEAIAYNSRGRRKTTLNARLGSEHCPSHCP